MIARKLRGVTTGFNGAAFFQSGKCEIKRLLDEEAQAASMEPLFFKAENLFARCRPGASSWGLQWSRFFSKRKICRGVASFASPDGSFNGAAFFQSGKWNTTMSIPLGGLKASMEPLFFKAENLGAFRRSKVLAFQLQWSRFFSKRKILTCLAFLVRRERRFNGAAFFQSGKLEFPPGSTPIRFGLQWSRFFSKRKIGDTTMTTTTTLKLQWSRFFSKRKIPVQRRANPVCQTSFNGAAFFQSGKSR